MASTTHSRSSGGPARVAGLAMLAGAAIIGVLAALRGDAEERKRHKAGHSDSAEGDAVDVDRRPAASAGDIHVDSAAPA